MIQTEFRIAQRVVWSANQKEYVYQGLATRPDRAVIGLTSEGPAIWEPRLDALTLVHRAQPVEPKAFAVGDRVRIAKPHAGKGMGFPSYCVGTEFGVALVSGERIIGRDTTGMNWDIHQDYLDHASASATAAPPDVKEANNVMQTDRYQGCDDDQEGQIAALMQTDKHVVRSNEAARLRMAKMSLDRENTSDPKRWAQLFGPVHPITNRPRR